MGPPLTTKKSGEKFVEKDPFLVPLSNNNTDHTTVLVKTLDDVQLKHVNNTLSRHTMSLITGIFLIGLGFLCFTVSSQLESAFDQLALSHTALSAGGKDILEDIPDVESSAPTRPNVHNMVHPSTIASMCVLHQLR